MVSKKIITSIGCAYILIGIGIMGSKLWGLTGLAVLEQFDSPTYLSLGGLFIVCGATLFLLLWGREKLHTVTRPHVSARKSSSLKGA